MKFQKFAIVGAIAISSLALAGCKTQGQDSMQASNSSANSTSDSAGDSSSSAVITFDGSSFSPANLNVKAGETITVNNTSSETISFNSDPHPTHTLFPELNVGSIEGGQSKTFTISKAGTYTYHDHFNASMRGTITVE